MRSIKKGSTSQSVYFEVLDSTSTTGGRKTGLVFNSSGLTAYYARNGAASVAITLATLASASAAWSSGGFVEVDAPNMPGLYRLDVPNAALVTGADSVVFTIKGATGMAQISNELALVDNNSLDIFSRIGAPVGASISADIAQVETNTLANGTAIAALPTTTTVNAIKAKTDSLTFTVAGMVDGNVVDWKGAAAPAMTGDAFARLGAPAGASVSADIAAIKSDTGTVLTDVNTGAGAIYTRLGAPAGASIAADIAAVKTDTGTNATAVAAVKAKTDSLAFTVAGKVDSNVLAVNGDATAAVNLQASTDAICRGTVGAASSTTSIITSAFSPAPGAIGQFIGRTVIFDANTATVALRGQATNVTNSTNSATPTLTVTALTTAPASGDTFSIV